MPFLKNHRAVLNFERDSLHLKTKDIPFTNHHTFHLPARMKKLISIPIANNEIKERYLEKIATGLGIYLGESLVRQEKGYAKVYAINTNTHTIDVTLAPIELEDYRIIPPRFRVNRTTHLRVESEKIKSERLANPLVKSRCSRKSEAIETRKFKATKPIKCSFAH